MSEKMYISYNHIHQLCQESSTKVKEFKPDLIIAIGGGGFIPARMLRSFLKEQGKPNVRIMAVILSLYEEVDHSHDVVEDLTSGKPSEVVENQIGTKVIRTQWIDYNQSKINLINKNVLIIDEVDDTRTTLHYTVNELQKDVASQVAAYNATHDDKVKEDGTKFGIFVLHDKIKPKKRELPADVMENYIAARTVEDVWIAYPWESVDIVNHTSNAMEQGNDVFLA